MKLPPIIFTLLVITTVVVGIVFTQQKARSTMEQDSTLRKKVLWEKATEMPFTGIFDDFFEEGTYYCAGCGTELFSSTSKYNSGCGWPAFSEALDNGAVEEVTDYSHGMVRTEVRCKKCHAHLGHVFNDGPRPTGLRYCINSVSLDFKPKATAEKK